METLYQAFLATAERSAGNAYLCVPPLEGRDYCPQGIEYSYGQAREHIEAIKGIYAAGGYGHGHRVALLLGNRPEMIFHFIALNGLGVSIVPVNPDYRHDEILYQMEHSEADLAVSIPSRLPDLEAVARERAKPLPVAAVDGMAALPPAPSDAPIKGAPGLNSESALLYTSGTTGRPKGCIHTNEYVLNAGQWYLAMGGRLSMEPGRERLIIPLPLFHMNALEVSHVAMLLSAGCLVLPDRFHPKSWWREVVAGRATVIHYLGVMPPLLINQPEVPEEKQHIVKFGLGAGIEPELHGQFEQRFGFPLVEVWGMTETGRIFADAYEPRQIHTRAFGKPRDGFEAKVVDDDDREVPRGTAGELVVRMAGADPRRGFFAGYLKNPEATAEAWKNGWFHTGDVARQDAEDMLYFVDRKKNIIRRSGENIAGAEIEEVLQPHPDVAQVAVLPVKDELREEEVLACIVPMEGVAGGPEKARELFDYCMQKLAYFKVPGWILFTESLPTTSTQKVQKTKIFAADEDPRQRPGITDLRELKRRGR